jgi:hypothetical protein
MTHIEFFQAYNTGQRHFSDLDFEYLEGFSNKDFSDILFENCFLNLDFRNSDLTNAKFITCNLTFIDLRKANLTNGLLTDCRVECALFKGAIVKEFKFISNHYYGVTLGQDDFNKTLIYSDAPILKSELSKVDFTSTMTPKMLDVTTTAMPVVDIWPFVKELVYEGIVENHVFTNNLIERVYRNQSNWCDQILLPTGSENVFIVILVDIEEKKILGYHRLDLNKEYGLDMP